MSISVVIPTAGTLDEHGLPRLADALAAAALADEVVVVTTNGQLTAPAAAAIVKAERDLGREWIKVIDVQNTPFNFSAAINAGVAATDGEQILLLNDDIKLPAGAGPEWLTKLAGKKGDVKGVMLLQADEKTIEHAGVWFAAPGGMPCHIGQYSSVRAVQKVNGQMVVARFKDGPQGAVTGAAMMVTRRAFNRVKGWDEGFALNYNDVDFCLRVQEKGMKVMVHNSIRLLHNESSTRGWSMPTEDDFHRLAAAHRAFLRKNGVFVDEFAASRFRRQVVAQREQEASVQAEHLGERA